MSDIWERKMRTYFRRLDFDKDGVIRPRDFEAMRERFCDMEKIDPEQREKVRQYFSDFFALFTKTSGSTDDVVLTEDLLIESMRLQKDDPSFKELISDCLHCFVTAMQDNQDEHLDIARYRRLFEDTGMTETDFTTEAFKAIDRDGDGKLSVDELVKASQDYFCSDDADTTALYGLLV